MGIGIGVWLFAGFERCATRGEANPARFARRRRLYFQRRAVAIFASSERTISMKLFHKGALAAVCMLALAPLAHGQAAPQRIRGDVAAVHGKDLDVKTNAGQVVTVRMTDNLRVSARGPADLGSIAPGAFIGTTAVAQPDGTLKAVEVHVFPESMRGTGEGHRPMETEQPGSTMTNATVTSVAPAKA